MELAVVYIPFQRKAPCLAPYYSLQKVSYGLLQLRMEVPIIQNRPSADLRAQPFVLFVDLPEVNQSAEQPTKYKYSTSDR